MQIVKELSEHLGLQKYTISSQWDIAIFLNGFFSGYSENFARISVYYNHPGIISIETDGPGIEYSLNNYPIDNDFDLRNIIETMIYDFYGK